MKPVKLVYDVVVPDGDSQRNLHPIILLHGMTDSRKTWRPLAPEIAKQTGRIVYAYDARNHGESEWSNQLSFDILASDLERFMDEMEISKAILIGHSMGGKTALTLALKKPERVEKLIVEDMVARNWTVKPGSVNLMSPLIPVLRDSLNSIPEGASLHEAQKAVADYVKQFIPPTNSPENNPKPTDPSLIALKRNNDGSFAWQANLDVLEDVLTNLDKLQQKFSGVYMGDALFLYGPKSFFRVDRDKLIPLLFPKSQVIPIKGAAHLLHMEYPEQFLQHVISFIVSPQQLKSKY